jgi:plastocyanin
LTLLAAAGLAGLLGNLTLSAAHAGEVEGIVLFPAPPVAANLATPGLMGSGTAPEARRAVDPVLVYVAQAEGALPRTASAPTTVKIARGKATPAFVAVSLGSEVTFENADRRAHRLVCRRPVRKDLGPLMRGAQQAMTFDEAGNHTLGCALHDDVRIEVVVLAHAAFAVADAQGRFRLPELPAGRATVVAYSPRLGEVSREIEIPETGIAAIDLTF